MRVRLEARTRLASYRPKFHTSVSVPKVFANGFFTKRALKMVLREYGHRNHFDLTEYLTLQRKMAVLDIDRDFLPQHIPFCDLPHNNHPALRALSENLLFDGYPPGSIPLSRHIAYGARYDCQYVLLRLRTGVG